MARSTLRGVASGDGERAQAIDLELRIADASEASIPLRLGQPVELPYVPFEVEID